MPKNDSEMVLLFSRGAPKGMCAIWLSGLDWMSFEPKNATYRARQISEFVDIYYAAETTELIGFKLLSFSRVIGHVREQFRLAPEDRVRLDALLLFYKGIHLGASRYWDIRSSEGLEAAERVKENIRFLDEKIDDLRKMVGDATIFQPEHARTLPL